MDLMDTFFLGMVALFAGIGAVGLLMSAMNRKRVPELRERQDRWNLE